MWFRMLQKRMLCKGSLSKIGGPQLVVLYEYLLEKGRKFPSFLQSVAFVCEYFIPTIIESTKLEYFDLLRDASFN